MRKKYAEEKKELLRLTTSLNPLKKLLELPAIGSVLDASGGGGKKKRKCWIRPLLSRVAEFVIGRDLPLRGESGYMCRPNKIINMEQIRLSLCWFLAWADKMPDR